MLLVTELLRWWYSDGWRLRAQHVAMRLDGTIDYFSVGLLFKTLFSPYRQISAGRTDGPLGVKLQAALDKLISRVIGAFIRLILLVIGGIMIAFYAVAGIVILAIWALVPFVPLVGIGLALTGWSL